MNVEERSKQIRENWPEAVTPFMQSAALVQRLSSLLQETIKPLLKTHGLTHMEFDVLAALRSQKQGTAMNPSGLRCGLLISSGGLTKVLKSLEKKSFISRSASDSDARHKPIMLTDKGREKLEKIMPEIAANAEKLLRDGFKSTEECGAFSDGLKRIIRAAEREISGKGL
nr:MarR family transcriptional regulator [uncultured Cohaesibacter sp.]